jgi:hypothetical protein
VRASTWAANNKTSHNGQFYRKGVIKALNKAQQQANEFRKSDLSFPRANVRRQRRLVFVRFMSLVRFAFISATFRWTILINCYSCRIHIRSRKLNMGEMLLRRLSSAKASNALTNFSRTDLSKKRRVCKLKG